MTIAVTFIEEPNLAAAGHPVEPMASSRTPYAFTSHQGLPDLLAAYLVNSGPNDSCSISSACARGRVLAPTRRPGPELGLPCEGWRQRLKGVRG
jgi:hypothetical protein